MSTRTSSSGPNTIAHTRVQAVGPDQEVGALARAVAQLDVRVGVLHHLVLSADSVSDETHRLRATVTALVDGSTATAPR